MGTTPQARKWTDTTVRELKAFVGLLLEMGCLRHPRFELYWSKKYPELETPGIAAVMPLKRFKQLFRCLHIVDNSKNIPYGQPGHDKLFKVRPLLDALVPRFTSEYKMHKECSIDEAMIPFKRRLAFKQYIKDKLTKWGIKVFVLADAHNGYVSNLEVYRGKNVESRRQDIGLTTKDLGGQP